MVDASLLAPSIPLLRFTYSTAIALLCFPSLHSFILPPLHFSPFIHFLTPLLYSSLFFTLHLSVSINTSSLPLLHSSSRLSMHPFPHSSTLLFFPSPLLPPPFHLLPTLHSYTSLLLSSPLFFLILPLHLPTFLLLQPSLPFSFLPLFPVHSQLFLSSFNFSPLNPSASSLLRPCSCSLPQFPHP